MSRKIAAKHKVKIPVQPLFSKPKPKVEERKSSKPHYAGLAPKPNHKLPVKTKPSVHRNKTAMPLYGEFGLVQYTKASREVTDADLLTYKMLPAGKQRLQSIAAIQKRNMFEMYSSLCRLIYQFGGVGMPEPKTQVSDYDFMLKKIQCDYMDDYLVDFVEHEALWVKHYEKIFDALEHDFKRMGANFCKYYNILALRPSMQFKSAYVPMLLYMWKKFGLPMIDNHNTNVRYYIFTSSIPGKLASEKLDFLSKLPKKFLQIVCLVGDDIKLSQLTAICKKLKVRGSFDPTKIKIDGDYIKHDNATLVDFASVGKHEGSTPSLQLLFLDKNNVSEKLLKYYGSLANLILY